VPVLREECAPGVASAVQLDEVAVVLHVP
jgi:hypothetical protein